MTAPEMLKFNTVLRTFYSKDISLQTVNFGDPDPRKIMTAIVGKVASANIQKITFGIRLNTIEALNDPDWEAMKRVLSQPEFAHLHRINFHVSVLKKEATLRIRAGLPKCMARGIVHVSQPVLPRRGRL